MERAVLPFGELWVACVGTEVVGAAMWMHPDRVPYPAVWSSMNKETAALEGSRHRRRAVEPGTPSRGRRVPRRLSGDFD